MTKKNFAGLLEEIQGAPEENLFREMLRVMIQGVMEEEIDHHLGAGYHERSTERKGYRNGYKPRTLNTRVGKLKLDVPQARNTEPYSPVFYSKYQRSERALLVACAEMYFQGVSTRNVSNVLEKMGGFELSASTVSRIAADLDEKINEFRDRRLDGCTWPYIMVDATYLNVRKNKRVTKQAVLVIAGINSDGRREVLTWQMADTESEDTWTEAFRELKRRGVKGVKWVVSDGHLGIIAAATKQFNGASWQRCWTHFMRNAMAKVSHKLKDALAKELRDARKFDDVKICMAEAERIADRWAVKYPLLAKQIRNQFVETLAVHHLPSRHRRRVYTTNMMERIMREIKRRTKVVGIFPNPDSADRLVGARLMEIHEKWCCVSQRYICMEYLEDYEEEKLENEKVV